MKCFLCPRRCGVDRSISTGACGMGDKLKIARSMLHFGEEPVISGCKESLSAEEYKENPNVKECTENPTVKERTEKPTVKECAENPTVKECTENPTVKECIEKPNIKEYKDSLNATEHKEDSADKSSKDIDNSYCGQAAPSPHSPKRPDVSLSLNALNYTRRSGSGAIFFSGCSLGCVYCQNREISRDGYGFDATPFDLAEQMLSLQDRGAVNINLVTPTHFSDKIAEALSIVRGKLTIPVVYNTSGYELPSVIEKISSFVDIFLTDIKYFSPEVSEKYSSAPDYYKFAKASFAKMLQACPSVIIENGVMKKGVILRHLTLPSLRHESVKILNDISESFDINKFKLSLMSQYTPLFCPPEYKELSRKITAFEYKSVLETAVELGFDGYMQDLSSSSDSYIPKFKEN